MASFYQSRSRVLKPKQRRDGSRLKDHDSIQEAFVS